MADKLVLVPAVTMGFDFGGQRVRQYYRFGQGERRFFANDRYKRPLKRPPPPRDADFAEDAEEAAYEAWIVSNG